MDEKELIRIAEIAANTAAQKVAGQLPTMLEIQALVEKTANEAAAEAATKAAKEAANLAVIEILTSLGLDPKDRSNIIKDFIFVSELRKTFQDGKRHAFFALISMFLLAIGTAVFAYVKGLK